ncbi:poly-beta-1,6 N-acetyl-D-glucosamine export porin PgaA [Rhodoferax sp. WC2427]|uniref:poly-beta-1,6 N-acetyl-D-glucosamine export porin PgaA n=1 Tax=Rhodoferax sp. WC2427 TaxID=3234144 RepID=UPI003466153E
MITSLTGGAQTISEPPNAYQQAISNARAGRFDAALPMLERLVQQHPYSPAYRYDWIAVLSWSNRHAEALAASQAVGFTTQVPDYVVSAIGKSALNAGHPQRAEAAYRSLLARHPRDADAAQGLVMSLQAQQFPVAPVALAPSAPTAPAAPPTLPSRDWSAEQAQNGAHIRAAMAVLDTDFTLARYAPMDAALADNSALTREAITAHQMGIARRLRLDHIVGLQARGTSAQAWNEFQALDAEGDPLPAYALTAAADALMALRQPEQARALYQRALAADPGNSGTQTGLMYAELEAENFPGMEQIVQQRLEATQRSVAARRTEVSALRFADRIPPAAAALAQLHAEFPDDVGLWLDQADLLSQRGLPRAAAERYRAVLAADPANTKARIGLTDAVWAQGDIAEAAQMVAALQAEAPEHPAVQRLLRAWERRQRPFLTSSATWGFGSGQVTGNDDMSWSTSLYSGQNDQGLRIFATHHLARAQWWWDSAHLYQGSASHERGGVGLEWTRRDLQATVEAGTDLRNGRDAVGAVGVNWQVNDHLSLRGRYESQTNDFPLKGRVPDVESNLGAPTYLHADKKTVGVAYRWNESRRVAADISSYRFNDGNQRSALAASWSERLYSGYGRTLDLQTAAYTSANSLRDAVYFNPRRDFAVSETLAADWLTWRHYERSFNQRIAVSVGLYRQQSGDGSSSASYGKTYGWNPFYGVHYEHEWQFGPDRSLRYGIGARRFPYDGKFETSRYIDATLNWRF